MPPNSLKCIIVDDEPNAIELLISYVENIPFLKLEASFLSPIEALSFIQSNKVDLLFLDVNMPLLSGMQLMKALEQPPMCILTTAYAEYALQGYELNVVDYLLKPIEFDRFLMACNKAWQKSKASHDLAPSTLETKSIKIKSGQRIYQLNPMEVLFAEASGNYTIIHTRDKKIMTLMNMEEASRQLSHHWFLRVHRSFIVNLQQIKSVENHKIEMNGTSISVSKSYRKAFMEVFNA